MPYKVFNSDEAAAYLHVPREALDRLVKNKEIPFEVQGGRVVFSRNDIDTWATQRILRLSGERLEEYHNDASKSEPDKSVIMPALVKAQWVEPELRGRTASGVLRSMVEVADRSEKLGDPKELLRLLEEREELCSTGIPGGVALLHPRRHAPFMFLESFIAIGRAPAGIPFGSPDGELTDLFFLICCGDDRSHLHTLARLCAMVQKTPILEAIRAAGSGKEIADAVRLSERRLLKIAE